MYWRKGLNNGGISHVHGWEDWLSDAPPLISKFNVISLTCQQGFIWDMKSYKCMLKFTWKSKFPESLRWPWEGRGVCSAREQNLPWSWGDHDSWTLAPGMVPSSSGIGSNPGRCGNLYVRTEELQMDEEGWAFQSVVLKEMTQENNQILTSPHIT